MKARTGLTRAVLDTTIEWQTEEKRRKGEKKKKEKAGGKN